MGNRPKFCVRVLGTRASFCLLLLLLIGHEVRAIAAEGNGWPSLRGLNHDGYSPETGLVDGFPPEGPPVLWARRLGAGYSGFAAEGDRVYTQYQVLSGQYVVCLNAVTGDTLWEYRCEGPYDPAGLYPGPRATPSLAHGRVYFSSPGGIVGCLEAKTGQHVWSFNVFQRFGVEAVEFGYSCSPTLVGDKVLLPVGPPESSMVALRADNGELIWHSGDDVASHVAAFPISLGEQQLVIGYLRNTLCAYELETGRIAWRIEGSTGYNEHAAWPIFSSPYLWIAAPFRWGSELLELKDDGSEPRSVWRSSLLSNDVCSSVLVDGHLYGFDIKDMQTKPHRPSRGQFRCLEFLTGRECWSNGSLDVRRELDDETESKLPLVSEGNTIGQASVLYADGKLILFNDVGELILARATPEQYEELGRVRVLGGEICWTQPTLFQGRLFVRNHTRAACLVLSRATTSGEAMECQATLTVADIPQSHYQDWASWLIPAEPEFMMDVPSAADFRRWFFIALEFGGVAILLGLVCEGVAWSFRRTRGENPAVPALATRGNVFRHVALTCALGLGAMGTTVLGFVTDKFEFTWPLCLYLMFVVTLYHSGGRNREGANSWRDRLVLCVFLTLCTGYFLLCRRLSLAFEWAFLAGFPAAVPFLLAGRWQSRRHRFACLGEVLLIAAGFGAYYWSSVGGMFLKYEQHLESSLEAAPWHERLACVSSEPCNGGQRSTTTCAT